MRQFSLAKQNRHSFVNITKLWRFIKILKAHILMLSFVL